MGVRFANLKGRATLILGSEAWGDFVDVEQSSSGRFPADPMAALECWDELVEWAESLSPADVTGRLQKDTALCACVPRPSKVFGIGLNYRTHAAEMGAKITREPIVFTKFPSCLIGSQDDIVLSSDYVDWEAELVVVIGRRASRISETEALDYVAGFCVGQDISDRRLQFSGQPPQFSLGKSIDTFGPIGPTVTTLDHFDDSDDLAIVCDINGERMQDGRTSDMVFSVADLVAYLASICTLVPGDLIFTGTPSGVGFRRKPARYLKPGDRITTSVVGIGELCNRCVEDKNE